MNKQRNVTLILLGVLLLLSIMILNMKFSLEKLQSDYYLLQEDYYDIQRKYRKLRETQERLKQEYGFLQEKYSFLNGKYNTLLEKYNKLYSEYQELQSRCQETMEKLKVKELLTMPSGLDEHYEEIRRKIYLNGYHFSKEGELSFYALAVLHDVGEINWSPLYEEFYRIHGVHCSYLSRSFLFNLVNYITNGSRGIEGVRLLYEWVRDNVRYEPEEANYPRFPVETLVYRVGDCEDQAMALAALLKVAGYDVAIGLITDDVRGFYHVFTFVRLDGYLRGTWRIGRYESLGYVWKMLDPAFEHDFYENPAWINQYRTKSGVAISGDVLDAVRLTYEEVMRYLKH